MTTAMATKRKTIAQVQVESKCVLMRVDFNVPLDADGQIIDNRRIEKALPSIRSVIDRGGRLVLMSHLGRPAGRGPEPELSLAPMARRLGELLDGTTVHFPGESIGPKATRAVESLGAGEIVLLENLRFHREEKKGDPEFASKLAAYGDIYCDEAFGTSHRSDASMLAVPAAMQGKPRVAGLLLEKEIAFVGGVLDNPARPLVAVLGGVKVSDKIGVLHNLLEKVDTLLVGGAMAYTLLKATGCDVGKSLVEPDMLGQARKIIDEAASRPVDLILPEDHTCGKQLADGTPVVVTDGQNIGDGWMGLDLGPKTMNRFAQVLGTARTIIWNGPMGAFELEPFHVGTRQVAAAIAKATAGGAVSVVGGGETAASIDTLGLAGRYTHVSTGGGAMLELLEGRTFEAIEVLDPA